MFVKIELTSLLQSLRFSIHANILTSEVKPFLATWATATKSISRSRRLRALGKSAAKPSIIFL